MLPFLVKGDRSGDDPIFALNQEATLRAGRGESIINATVGVLLEDNGTLAVLPTAARAVKEVREEDWAGYAPISGNPAFLEAVMDDLFANQPAMRAAAAAVATPGGSGALRHVISTFLEPGQALLTTSFFWGPYETLADEHQRRVETFEMFDPKSDMGRLHFEALDRKLSEIMAAQGRAVLFVNDPCQNPTGYSMSEDDWRSMAEVVGRHASRGPVAIVLDAAYAAYAKDGTGTALRALESLLGRALVLVAWSASKTFTHYGLRVGALVALLPDDNERKRVESALGYACRGTWSNCNRGGMTAVTRLLREPALATAVAKERNRLVGVLDGRVSVFNELARPRGLRYPRYDGGFFVTMFVEDARAAAAKMKEHGVFVVPLKGALRVALCSVAAANIPRLVDSLEKANLVHARDV
ncbi:MAG TPA: aminotransferase class I/II-fold pyridoxal phosphate-dependent enzyme [Polyangiaceae bacterium]|nr:aminotransferase class I/II-fold pyridoxal phosphate-dependent enzyme [Polyangiaceae bacterium]